MKTRVLFVTCITMLAALFISQAVFAEAETPPAIEEPAAQTAEETPVTEPELPEGQAEVLPPADTAEASEESTASLPVVSAEVDPVEALPLVEEVLEDPQIVILDENGSALDMASVETAGVIASADPYYKVGTVTYRFLVDCSAYPDSPTSICVEDPNPIQAAIDDIRINNRMPSDGKIYVEKDTYSDTVSVDATTYAFLAALKGLVGVADINGVFPTISGSVTVLGTTTGFTLSGFNINNAVVFNNNVGSLLLQDLVISNPNGHGLDVDNHTGNVSLVRVTSKNNKNKGAEIDNQPGGAVAIKDSQFTGNGTTGNWYGIRVLSNGAVTIDGLSVSNNSEVGLRVQNFSKLTIKNASFYKNTYNGAFLWSGKPAPVILENIYAYENGYSGVEVSTTGGSVAIKNIQASLNKGGTGTAGLLISNGTGTVFAPVTITNGRFNNNTYDGLAIVSKGNITLTNVSATDNDGRGVTIQNYEGSGNVTIKSSLIGDYYDFSRNAFGGIDIQTSGSVIVSNVYANDSKNGTSGMTVLATTALSDKPVTVSRAWFNDNEGAGLGINARGTITIIDVSASRNLEGSGISLANNNGQGNIVLKSSNTSLIMNFDDNKWNGIRILTNGSVLVSNVTARRNGLLGQHGIQIENNDGTIVNTPKPVTLSKAEVQFNGAMGLYIYSEGLVTLTDVNVTDNGTRGVGDEGAYISTSGSVTVKTSSVSRFAEFSRNPGIGLRIASKGTVTLTNLIANDNGFIDGFGTHGIVVDNRAAAGNVVVTNVSASRNGQAGTGYGLYIYHEVPGLGGTVTVKSSSPSAFYAFDDNSGYGLYVESQGAVTISNIFTQLGNGYSGIFIDNQSLPNNRPISVARVILENNSESGLLVEANGAVTLENIETLDNGMQGAVVDACWYDGWNECQAKGIVTLKGLRNVFSENSGSGLEITAGGNVVLANFTAENNNGGVSVTNDIGVSTGNVMFSASGSLLNVVKGNGINGGMSVVSNGAISIARVLAEGNGLYGIQINNYDSPLKAGITVNNVSANRNAQDGLSLQSQGSLLLNNIQAAFNDTNRGDSQYFSGVAVNYGKPANILNLTIGGTNYLANNTEFGLIAQTDGLVNIAGLTLDTNGNPTSGGGMYLDAQGVGKTVLLTNVTAVNNYLNGALILSQGAVTVKGSRFVANTNNGLWVQTNGNALTVQSNYFMRNTLYGVYVNDTPSLFINTGNVYLANLSGSWYLP